MPFVLIFSFRRDAETGVRQAAKTPQDPCTRPRDIDSKSTFEPSTWEYGSKACRSNFRGCFLSHIGKTVARKIESTKSRVLVAPGQVSDKLKVGNTAVGRRK